MQTLHRTEEILSICFKLNDRSSIREYLRTKYQIILCGEIYTTEREAMNIYGVYALNVPRANEAIPTPKLAMYIASERAAENPKQTQRGRRTSHSAGRQCGKFDIDGEAPSYSGERANR